MQGRHLGARAAGQDLEQAYVVHVLVRDHDQLELFDRVAVLGQGPLELVERLARVRTRVDQRRRPVLDRVAVDPADQERRGHGQPVDAGARGQRERLGSGTVGRFAHERITARTSSRRRSMSSRERSDSRHRRSSGSVFDGRTLKCQSSYSTESPSSRYWLASAWRSESSLSLASWSSTAELISPEMKYRER